MDIEILPDIMNCNNQKENADDADLADFRR